MNTFFEILQNGGCSLVSYLAVDRYQIGKVCILVYTFAIINYTELISQGVDLMGVDFMS